MAYSSSGSAPLILCTGTREQASGACSVVHMINTTPLYSGMLAIFEQKTNNNRTYVRVGVLLRKSYDFNPLITFPTVLQTIAKVRLHLSVFCLATEKVHCCVEGYLHRSTHARLSIIAMNMTSRLCSHLAYRTHARKPSWTRWNRSAVGGPKLQKYTHWLVLFHERAGSDQRKGTAVCWYSSNSKLLL